jgi:hypothetical protein
VIKEILVHKDQKVIQVFKETKVSKEDKVLKDLKGSMDQPD